MEINDLNQDVNPPEVSTPTVPFNAVNPEKHSSNLITNVENTLSTPVVPVIPPFHTPQAPLLNFTPKGTEEWTRKVDSECTPSLGKAFATLEEGIEFYMVYAVSCGFETRLSSSKRFRDTTIRSKCVVCNREGFKEKAKENTSDTKQKPDAKQETNSVTKIRRFGCKAMVKFAFKDGHYIITLFHEGHNHPLALAKNREFLKLSRKLSLYHKQTIINLSKINIGPTKTYRICKENSNGFQNVGASLLDFKNFQRDVKCYIGCRDAQMFISKLKGFSETKKGFFFAYEVDEDSNLRRVLWCDATARRNYFAFGDALSYDPTYSTNKYCMVFTPFTGVDNHNKTVCFGAALVSHENESSFLWVFQQFMKAMGNKEPQFIITDQDTGIKSAVRQVFLTARHRYCMWHIMQKLPGYVGNKICSETKFLARIDAVVWDSDLETFEFEEKWKEVIVEFHLEDHEWLKKIFKIRDEWIPSYFRDLPMGNILRTTQRSESSNSFFKKFENEYGTLIEFWMRFESAMDQQRHNHKRLEMESDHSIPQTVTPIALEKHARSIYTHELFYEFQEEVKFSTCACVVAGYLKTGNMEITTVDDTIREKVYDVHHVPITNETTCTCRLFERRGYVCRHILWIWSGKRLKEIPQKYVMARWTKNALRNTRYDIDGSVLEDYDTRDPKKLLMSDIWSEFYDTIGLLGKREEADLKGFLNLMKAFRKKFGPPGLLTKNKELEMLLDCPIPTELTILPPKQAKNKGSGKRLKGSKEKAMKKQRSRRECAGTAKEWDTMT